MFQLEREALALKLYLTLTNVVFEYVDKDTDGIKSNNLTLTNVVFE